MRKGGVGREERRGKLVEMRKQREGGREEERRGAEKRREAEADRVYEEVQRRGREEV